MRILTWSELGVECSSIQIYKLITQLEVNVSMLKVVIQVKEAGFMVMLHYDFLVSDAHKTFVLMPLYYIII